MRHNPIHSMRGRLTVLLAAVLIFVCIQPAVYAADDIVNGLELDAASSTLSLFVGDSTELSALASYQGYVNKREVTASATWKTTDSSVATVSQGSVRIVGAGSARVSATYAGFSATVQINATYAYDSISLSKSDTGAAVGDTLDATLGSTLKLLASGMKNSASNDLTSSATWSSSNTAVATVEKGAITLVGAGKTTITAAYKGKSSTVTLQVKSPYQSLTISPNDLIELKVEGSSAKLTASVKTAAGSTENVTTSTDTVWTSSNETVATVTDDGEVEPVAAGTAVITASRYGVSDTVTVVVRPEFQAMKITPDANLDMLVQDSPASLTVSVLDAAGATKDITKDAVWTSTNVMVATVSEGVVTPMSAGTATIRASYKGLSKEVQVTVYPPVVSIAVSTTELDAIIGDNKSLPTVTGTAFGGEKTNVTSLVHWTSSDEEVLTVKDGKWEAKKAGTAVLTATARSLKATVTVTVYPKPLLLSTDSEDLSLIIGKETDLPKIKVTNVDGTEEDVTSKVKWKSTSDNLLLQSTKMKGLVASRVNLTATYLNKSVTIRITIEEEIVKLAVDPAALTLNIGKTKAVKVTGTYKSGKTIQLATKMKWTVGSESVARMTTSTIKALAVGATTITGEYQGKTVTIALTVVPKLKTFVGSDKSVNMAVGAAYTLKVKAFYDNGSWIDATTLSDWTSSKPSVATVVNGVVTATGKGTASIKATFQGKIVSVHITVK
ncbi:Ig domain protein group 2 domain protein [Paenibacillus curdlanolyticus YK9]|uniref:Ig domain protein group 2 domain protein n=1 Tax=Paenibacillus curdlanolyticus YK9 TaxID=717606 RepID=E0IEG1_9BACL|nr:Ig-like domain-containing protein [Paenibacillus curdlanolyticus]EFM09049.1 Ig domain protein group 2 domain protein [Paenibacillus curdlanolyticus YK9]